jgi:hypothetical protein
MLYRKGHKRMVGDEGGNVPGRELVLAHCFIFPIVILRHNFDAIRESDLCHLFDEREDVALRGVTSRQREQERVEGEDIKESRCHQ